MSSILRGSPEPSPTRPSFLDESDDDAETASQRSISLSSPATPNDDHHQEIPKHPFTPTLATPRPKDMTSTMRFEPMKSPDTETSSLANSTSTRDVDGDSSSIDANRRDSSAASSVYDNPPVVSAPKPGPEVVYPPKRLGMDSDAASMTSFSSNSSRKARPESLLLQPPAGPLVLGIGLVDFNHLVGPRIEFSDGEIFDDEQLSNNLAFLALPDGAHMSTEDYSYFHLVPSTANPTTIFGISCNRQIKAEDLLAKDADVTRSTVQKAVVVLASKPLFGPIRDKLGVVTRALFNQRDFHQTDILVDFRASLENSLRTQLTESAIYMGTNLRELVHKFRTRTLLLLKALMLQKRIMFYGHPVERLCTYQYSLVSLIPGLLQTLDDCGSPPLASRAPTLSRPTSLRTSDRKSLLAYLGLPLDIFGKDSFFQPYLPLQQLDMIKETPSWLCGSTNSIVTQQKEIDLLVNIEANTFEFRDPKLEQLVALTPADRKWMDEIVKDVNEGWDDSDPTRPSGMHFKGSDDYLRTKFEEYVSAALSSVKYADFMAKSERQDILITGGSGTPGGSDAKAILEFNPLWIADFRRTNAFDVWNRITDPLLFDICEARHPCIEKPNVVADIGLRLQEGLQDLKLEEQLAPTREAISRTLATGSTNLFKAMEGVRGRWAQRTASSSSLPDDASTKSSPPVEVTKSDADMRDVLTEGPPPAPKPASTPFTPRPLSLTAAQAANDTKATLTTWGSGIGSFLSQRAAKLSLPRATSATSSPVEPPKDGTGVGSYFVGINSKPKEKAVKPSTSDDPTLKPKYLGEGHGPRQSEELSSETAQAS